MSKVTQLHMQDNHVTNLDKAIRDIVEEHSNRSNITTAAVVGVLTIISNDLIHDVRNYNSKDKLE